MISFVRHQTLPVFGEWCRVCKAYTIHSNGFTRMLRAITVCHKCGHQTTY